MKLTGNQIEEIKKLQGYLKESLDGVEARPENTAKAVEELCENLDFDEALLICQGIWQGAEEMYRLCAGEAALAEPDFVENMLEQITEGMTKEQRKGFFLQSLDSFCKMEFSEVDTASRAALPEAALKELLAERIRRFSESAVCDMAETAGEPCFFVESKGSLEKVEITREDAFLFAVAEYIGGLNGTLPHEFGEYPELLGICAAAQITIAEQGGGDGKAEERPKLLFGILCAAAGAALALGIVAVSIAAGPVLLAMESSALGLLMSVFLSTILYFLFVINSLMIIGSVAAVIEACAKMASQRKEERAREGAETVYLEEAKKNFQNGLEESNENQEIESTEEVMA